MTSDTEQYVEAVAREAVRKICDHLWEHDCCVERVETGRVYYCERCEAGDQVVDHGSEASWADIQHRDDCIYGIARSALSANKEEK